ncbi:glycosyltransferase family 4 protein [Erysipelothrix inopinata]|uniref:Glycosyltransferase family 4 protein n=1 Tax=Erysipelothrix inopinata TaxID=225084 RepID=A0A7G9RXG2_9FIRM|nr:glycosyltransferase family 4 protein [Erysipelothrix inopinata]QNN60287.1 glycosyltransferase family 4 protein [Erysipelothrix inopinata]
MKVLYISSTYSGMHQSSIYFDLMQEFHKHGHDVYIAYAREKRLNKKTELYQDNNITYLGVKTMNMTKNTNKIEKGLATISIDSLFLRAFKKHFSNKDFDLVLYSTPPITFSDSLDYLKHRNPSAKFFLMLKDIFPQNAVDLELMSQKGLAHKFFKHKEMKLYQSADFIGVMSPANKEYFIKHYPKYSDKLCILPNTISIKDKKSIVAKRSDFGLGDDKFLLFFGGNLGEPQSIPFIIECAKKIDNPNIQIIIAGSGSKQNIISEYSEEFPDKLKYFGQLPSEEYQKLASLTDVGLIFLDYRFTIPNFPQRVLSYMESGVPVICATDVVSDVGSVAEEGNYGFKVSSQNPDEWYQAVENLYNSPDLVKAMGENGRKYLVENYDVKCSYQIIMDMLQNNQ